MIGTTYHRFGIRHHGPGSARSLVAALDRVMPEVVLIEGPPDADKLLEWAGHAEMEPPVALLVYEVETPSNAVFYPFGAFSPEWQAMRWAVARGVPVRFMDLPVALRMKDGPSRRGALDPLAALSEAAGYDEPELWWERQIEQRVDAAGMFEAIQMAMTTLRAESEKTHPLDVWEARREAHMRQTMRAAGADVMRVAVVCGAWHVPALDLTQHSVKADQALLKGLAKTKVGAAWIPWTHARLAASSGYGAGVDAPGWYAHLFESPRAPGLGWAAKAARALRQADLDASVASAVEVVRLADALAALRELAMAGLPELREAILTVLCGGDERFLRIVTRTLEVGEKLGATPAEAPATPLQQDVTQSAKSLRVPKTADVKTIELDLRKEFDREKALFFHRLRVIDVPWATPEAGSGQIGSGTFKEMWSLQWQPEYEVRLIDAARRGSTLVDAAEATLEEAARDESGLPELARRLDQALMARLPRAGAALLAALKDRAAAGADVGQLLAALPALARVARYSDVRGTDASVVLPLLRGMFERAVVELPVAATQVDDNAAQDLVKALDDAGAALSLLDDAALTAAWLEALARLAPDEVLHPLVRGRATRQLVEASRLDEAGLERAADLALSRAQGPARAGAWIEGLVQGSGLLLIHQDGLWRALDAWLVGLGDEDFVAVVALLRRAFADFSGAERRAMARRLTRLGPARKAGASDADAVVVALDPERAKKVEPVLAKVLGIRSGSVSGSLSEGVA